MKTTMKMILIFVDGELYKELRYRTKALAIGNYRIFKKHGVLNHNGEVIHNAIIELL